MKRLIRATMTASAVIATTSLLPASPASAKKAPPPPQHVTTTYEWSNGYLTENRYGNTYVLSTHFTDAVHEKDSAEAADDFLTTQATTTIDRVHVIGDFDRSAKVDDVRVLFYQTSADGVRPGQPISEQTIHPDYPNYSSWSIALVTPVTLPAGHYWVSIVADMNDLLTTGQWVASPSAWRWEVSAAAAQASPAVWRPTTRQDREPDCSGWCTFQDAWPNVFQSPADLRFQLTGTQTT